jgi:hypothetical protein
MRIDDLVEEASYADLKRKSTITFQPFSIAQNLGRYSNDVTRPRTTQCDMISMRQIGSRQGVKRAAIEMSNTIIYSYTFRNRCWAVLQHPGIHALRPSDTMAVMLFYTHVKSGDDSCTFSHAKNATNEKQSRATPQGKNDAYHFFCFPGNNT